MNLTLISRTFTQKSPELDRSIVLVKIKQHRVLKSTLERKHYEQVILNYNREELDIRIKSHITSTDNN